MDNTPPSPECCFVQALANEDTLLPTPMFHRLPARATFVADTKKCFWFCSETFCVRNKCFPVCAVQETSWATMCPQQCVLVYQGLMNFTDGVFFSLQNRRNVSVKSKLQQPPPGNPAGIWIFGKFFFKFPPPEAEKLFKYPIIGLFQVIKCPQPRETFW